jgi:arabinan endo-1,5-alpha-L-arabinosidase
VKHSQHLTANLKGPTNLKRVSGLNFILAVFISGILNMGCAQDMTSPIVHDPVMAKQGSMYYLFCTGMGISVFSSPDMKSWKKEAPVFKKAPDWTFRKVIDFKGHIWAPDISFHNGKYYLFYSVSSFAKNTSCIGLVTNKTLDHSSPDFSWVDEGMVVQSVPGRDMWNAIDPNLITDDEGNNWLTFGSFWNGIKLVKLNDDLKSVKQSPQDWYTICSRPRSFNIHDTKPGDGAVEAPFIVKKGQYYYLFVSFDYCCRGKDSNYKIMVGRSEKVTGPYLDKEGARMDQGGGSLLLAGDHKWPGVGHNSVYTFNNQDYIIFHGYDAQDNGKPKLLIRPLSWDEEGWPSTSLE